MWERHHTFVKRHQIFSFWSALETHLVLTGSTVCMCVQWAGCSACSASDPAHSIRSIRSWSNSPVQQGIFLLESTVKANSLMVFIQLAVVYNYMHQDLCTGQKSQAVAIVWTHKILHAIGLQSKTECACPSGRGSEKITHAMCLPKMCTSITKEELRRGTKKLKQAKNSVITSDIF